MKKNTKKRRISRRKKRISRRTRRAQRSGRKMRTKRTARKKIYLGGNPLEDLEKEYNARDAEFEKLKNQAKEMPDGDEKRAFMNEQVKPVLAEKTRLFELIKKEREEINAIAERIDEIYWNAYGTELNTEIAKDFLRQIDSLLSTKPEAKDDITKKTQYPTLKRMLTLLSSPDEPYTHLDMATLSKEVLENNRKINAENLKNKPREWTNLRKEHERKATAFKEQMKKDGIDPDTVRKNLKDMNIKFDNEKKMIAKQETILTAAIKILDAQLKKIQLQERAEERRTQQQARIERSLAKSEKPIHLGELRQLEEGGVVEGEGGIVEDEDEDDALLRGQAFARDQETSASVEQKLNFSIPLPSISGYDGEDEPEFWKPVFKPEEMLYIRRTLQQISREQVWRLCEIIKQNIKTYYYVVDSRNQTPRWLTRKVFGTFPPENHIKFNFILCATFIILGIISNKLTNQDYKLLFKGGKAIQLALDGIAGSTEYNSEDIDCLLMPKDGVYNPEEIKNLASHIAYLVEWFLKTDNPDISVLRPQENNLIFKLSYKYRIRGSKSDFFVAFSDIDFRQIPQDIQPFFEDTVSTSFRVDELDQDLLFEYPSIVSLLNEKIYYYLKYFMFKKILKTGGTITNPEYTGLTEDECDRILEKFKRAILKLTDAMYTEVDSRRKSIADRLNNDPLTSEIIASLYN